MNAGGDRLAGINSSGGTNSIKNNTIRDLQSNGSGTGFSFLPVGIYFTASTAGNNIEGNTISNVNNGIVVVGPTAAADANTGIDIGTFEIANENNSIIGNNQTATNFRYGTIGDTYAIFAIVLT